MTNQRLHHGNGQKNTWHGSHKQCGAVREHNHEKNGNNMMFSLFCAGTVVYGLMPKGGESRIFKRVLQQKEIENHILRGADFGVQRIEMSSAPSRISKVATETANAMIHI
ncbi:unnamed protein product [Caretta caretta]